MGRDANKVLKNFRIDRKTAGLLEQYAKEQRITQTEAIERAIKAITRQGSVPATQQDIQTIGLLIEQGFKATKEAIENQPIAALEEAKPKRGRLASWLFG